MKTNRADIPDGLYCLWMDDSSCPAIRVGSGCIIPATTEDFLAARQFASTTLAGCEAMDEMPTVSTDIAAVICEERGLSPELVAVCVVPGDER